jgi:hypothetical protein
LKYKKFSLQERNGFLETSGDMKKYINSNIWKVIPQKQEEKKCLMMTNLLFFINKEDAIKKAFDFIEKKKEEALLNYKENIEKINKYVD